MKTSDEIYIDLGTSNTMIYSRRRGLILNEPTMVALKQKTFSVEMFGLGQSAKRMLGKTPEHVVINRPLKEGVIANFDNAVQMLESFLERFKKQNRFFKPRFLISLPCMVSNFERRAVEEAGKLVGAGSVSLIAEPMAAALGTGLDVLKNRGCMVIDIGGGTTEIAVISLGGIVNCSAVRIGGDDLDFSIREHLRMQSHFSVGESTAEAIKMSVAHVDPSVNLSITVGGHDLTLALPRRKTITSSMIRTPVEAFTREILNHLSKTLETLPPEIAADIFDAGLVLTGGGALIGGLKEKIQYDLGVKVFTPVDPLFSVTKGGILALQNHKLYETIAENDRSA